MNLDLILDAPAFEESPIAKRAWWPPRPASGSRIVDILQLTFVSAMESHILPHITGGAVAFDLMTPWLVVSAIVQPASMALLLACIGGILVESSTTMPRGLCLCAYWVMTALILLVRKTLAWRHWVPWTVTLFASCFLVAHFETFFILIQKDSSQLDFFYFFRSFVRISLATAFGVVLVWPWMRRFKGDEL